MNPSNYPSKQGAFLAPMARITDIAFRSLAVDYSASLTTTELISSNGLLQNQSRSLKLAERARNEEFFSTQLFGKDPQKMADASEIIVQHQDSKFKTRKSFIDINLGCPVPKVVRNGMGSALLKNPELIAKIISQMADRVNNPITAKIRIGFDQKHINAVEVAKVIEDAGASLITVHGRTTEQAYSGTADWETIARVKSSVDIPVAGNGDIFSAEDALSKREESGVDYVALGRGASGNPLIFQQIKNVFSGRKASEISLQDKLSVFKEYIRRSKDFDTSFLHQKIQAQHFTKGLFNASLLRDRLSKTKTSDELLSLIDELARKSDE